MRLVFIVGLLIWGWLEIIAFIFVSNEIGGLLTLLGVFLTAIIGITLLKNQGLSILNRVRNDLALGHPPVVSIADSISQLATSSFADSSTSSSFALTGHGVFSGSFSGSLIQGTSGSFSALSTTVLTET